MADTHKSNVPTHLGPSVIKASLLLRIFRSFFLLSFPICGKGSSSIQPQVPVRRQRCGRRHQDGLLDMSDSEESAPDPELTC